MPLHLGTKQQGFALLGNTNIDKAYLGTSLVFQQGFVRTLTGIPPLTTPKATIGKDLINYKIYGNTVQGGLPSEYQRVEYLASTGTQYINTGIYLDFAKNIEIDTEFVKPTGGSRALIIGSYSSSNVDQQAMSLEIAATNQIRLYAQSKTVRTWNCFSSNEIVIGGKTKLSFSYNASNSTMDLNYDFGGPTYTDSLTDVSMASSGVAYKPLRFFIDHRAGTAPFANPIKIGATSIAQNGTLDGNFIPCYRKSDSKPGMYDTVTNTFYTNAGTGEFTVGANVYPTPTAPIEIESVGDLVLPSEYRQVEYLQSSGAQYIDTQYAPTDNTKWVLDAQFNNLNNQYNGRYDGTVSPAGQRCDIAITNNNFYINCGNATRAGAADTNRHTFVLDRKNGTASVDGTNYTLSTQTFVSTRPVYLFARSSRVRNENFAEYYCNEKIYRCQFYENEVLQKDLVPAVRKSDSKPGLYDTVTGTFYTNSGTGEFTVGADKPSYKIPIRTNGLPTEYRQVEYLESSGTQAIDTGIAPDVDVETDIDFEYASLNSYYNRAFGTAGVSGSSYGMRGSTTSGGYLYTELLSVAAQITTDAAVVANTRYSVKFNTSAHKLIVNDSEYAIPNVPASGSATSQTIALFGQQVPYSSGYSYGNVRVYVCKMYKNGQLVRNFIPAVRKSDSKPGMYDTVTGQFYTNAGTGEFAVGATVSAITLAQPLRRIVAGSTAYTDHTDYEAQKVYRQCGVKVFDGTEEWQRESAGTANNYYNNTPFTNAVAGARVLCSHFLGGDDPNGGILFISSTKRLNYTDRAGFFTDLNDFKAFLAAQYAAGTPVTIVYPLATATEESVTLPALPTERGATTTVDVATEVVPSSVEIVYRGK